MSDMTLAEYRKHLQKWNSIARLNGVELSQDEIEEMVMLYGKGYSPAQIVDIMMSGGIGEDTPAPASH